MRPEKARGATSLDGEQHAPGCDGGDRPRVGRGSQGRHLRPKLPKPPSFRGRCLPAGCTPRGKRAAAGTGRWAGGAGWGVATREGGARSPEGWGDGRTGGHGSADREETEGPPGTQPDARQALSRRSRSDMPGSMRRGGSVGSMAPGVGTQLRPAAPRGPRFKAGK